MKAGWEVRKLGEVCENITDGTHQTPKYFEEGYLFLSSKNVKSGKINWKDVRYIDEAQHLAMHKRLSPTLNDILLAKNGTTGVAAIVDRDCIFDIYVSLALLRPKEFIYPQFLLYFINSPIAKKQFNKRIKGSGVPNLHLKEIRQVEAPIPPLSEQKRIVKILDEAFSAIDQARANAEQNLRNSRELFESYLNGVFSDAGVGWEERYLGEVCEKIGSGATPKGGKESYKKEGISLIRSLNVHDSEFKYKNLAFIDKNQADKLSNVVVESGDVLLNITGASIARCNIVPDEILPARVNQHVSILRPKQEVLLSQFLYYTLTSKIHKDTLLSDGEKAGSTRQALTKVMLQQYAIKFPKIEHQIKIIDELHLIVHESSKLKEVYTKKSHELDELKKSILKRAFEGGL